MSKKIIRRSKRKTKERPVQGDFSRSQHVQLNHSTKPQEKMRKAGRKKEGRKIIIITEEKKKKKK